MDRYFRHENLIAYKLALGVARWIRYEARFPRRESNLKDQAQRAADSAVLNLAEGCNRDGKDRLYHFRMAMGSAAECGAVFDLLDINGARKRQEELRRVVALTYGLT
jgi:four helix bundle protein